MSPLFGTVLPYIGFVVTPCDARGLPIATPEDERNAHFETSALVMAWFGRFVAIPFGDIDPRTVDPANPKQYAPGDL